jgi:xanthine dehydrogenase YagR molybdenum-binding subunit
MAQDEKAKEPTVKFTAKAGLLADAKPMDVNAPVGDIAPWDADSWAQFEQMGKPRPRGEAPLKVTGQAKYTYDVKLPGMLYGRMIGAEIPAGRTATAPNARPGNQATRRCSRFRCGSRPLALRATWRSFLGTGGFRTETDVPIASDFF